MKYVRKMYSEAKLHGVVAEPIMSNKTTQYDFLTHIWKEQAKRFPFSLQWLNSLQKSSVLYSITEYIKPIKWASHDGLNFCGETIHLF